MSPHLVAVALCAVRLLPVTFLCPLLGGQAVPTTVRLALVLSLALYLHQVAGVRLAVPVESTLELVALALKEGVYGTAVGLVSALPFDSARMGGRLIDLFRGTSAEASLPAAGTREAATGDVLYQLLVALAVAAGPLALTLSGLVRGFGQVGLGAAVPTESAALYVVSLAGGALSTGLAVGAPIAAACLAVDCLLAMASKVAPQVNLQETGAPLRILGGGALLWLGVGLMSERLLAGVLALEDTLAVLGEVSGE